MQEQRLAQSSCSVNTGWINAATPNKALYSGFMKLKWNSWRHLFSYSLKNATKQKIELIIKTNIIIPLCRSVVILASMCK